MGILHPELAQRILIGGLGDDRVCQQRGGFRHYSFVHVDTQHLHAGLHEFFAEGHAEAAQADDDDGRVSGAGKELSQ